MKKLLLMLASWSFLLLGAVSFTSCGDDDDDKGGSSLVEKYGNKKGVTIDGNNVVASTGYGSVTVYTFSSDDKLQSAVQSTNFISKEAAKLAYDNFAASGEVKNLKREGTVVSYTIEMSDVEGLSKSQLIEYLEKSSVYND